MKEVKVIKSFFRNGEWIREGEIVKVDKTAYNQLVEEEGLCIEMDKEKQ
jgi:hypothetical protein